MRDRVLVVEDNALTRKSVVRALAGQVEVLEAATATEAIFAFSQTRPTLVLLDLAIGDVDGFELLRDLRRLGPDVPVVAFTGATGDPRMEEAQFAAVLHKPVEPRRLREVVHRLLRPDAAQIAIPRASTKDRAWSAMTKILSTLSDLAAETSSLSVAMHSVLEALLDAAGFSTGLAWCAHHADLHASSCIGVRGSSKDALVRACEAEPAFAQALIGRAPVGVNVAGTPAFDEAGVASLIVVPLHQYELMGLIVLATGVPLQPEWLEIVQLIARPVIQSVSLARTVARLSASEHKFRGIAEASTDGIVLSSSAGVVRYANASAERIFGRKVFGERVEALLGQLASGVTTGNLYRADGTHIQVEVSERTFEDPPGVANRVHVLCDLSMQTRLDELAHIASHDALTGICNRRRLHEELETRLATSSRHNTHGAVLLIDLDHFKPINDRYGHHAGDRMLQAVATLLNGHTRKSDVTARLGGDEFVMLLDHTSAEGAEICATRVLDAIQAIEVPLDGLTLRVGASIGIAVFPADGASASQVLAAADAALYRAKREGKGRFACGQPLEPIDARITSRLRRPAILRLQSHS